jgi:hypothetical protein
VSPVRRAAALVAVEGAGLVLVGGGYGVAAVAGDPFDRTGALLQAGFTVLVGLLVLLVARGLHRTARWSQSPAVLLQLLALPAGVGFAQSGVWYAAAPVLLLAAAVLYLLATPQARVAFPDARR